MKEEFIEISQDVAVLSKSCPEDLTSVKPEEVSECSTYQLRQTSGTSVKH